jgi:cyclic pyranopterin monophosphate synthase
MVDVSAKRETEREAIAECEVLMSRAATEAIQGHAVKKGDPLQAARLAGILAAKRTADLIPLCHQIPLSHVDVEIQMRPWGCRIRGRALTVARTGVEMEAMVAALVAALTMYDMLKAVDRAIVIGPAHLLEKRGGRSGHYRRT